ncbi:Dyp-type peroxidase [Chitinophaga sp. SYP-B3965]|uniref:Dyp-type peroxidase n=1 Tax=Chitinophaga sp. SYP-B3965 TaxID=2663120 RepID=UPI001299A1E5|nr:Dyp-type peroxidase [Chitinophaga sp. SYP-B3965]MRG48731.1 Dyp-type peroxidase [Chitinophaga sp. SYP-B3965]
MIINNTTPLPKVPADPALQQLFKDMQGNILKSHARPNVCLLFVQFKGAPVTVKQWIRTKVAPLVVSMTTQLEDIEMHRQEIEKDFCSFSLTAKGYDFLLSTILPEDESFREGLGKDTIPADPPKSNWEEKYQKEIHAVFILAHGFPEQLSLLRENVIAMLSENAILVAEETGQALKDANSIDIEHFGYADGRSQPRYFEDDMKKEGTDVNWNAFASLDLVLTKDPLGKAFKQDDTPASDDTGTHSYGSYLVFRKLEQDVSGWNDAVLKHSLDTGQSQDLVGAMAVGRFKDGTPVLNHNAPQGSPSIENDFNYTADPQGKGCPFHAHIRKSNPRGDTQQFGVPLENEKTRRITRRGIPYTTGEKKGLLFMCYQQSIIEQFDFMQNNWVDNPGFLKGNTGVDAVIGQTIDLKGGLLGQHVHLKGGEYFFTPSISFLRTL